MRLHVAVRKIGEAIEAHVVWVARLENTLAGVDREHVRPEQVGDDTACEFGRWLQSPDCSLDPALRDRVEALHRNFHVEAARVAAMIGRQPASAVQAEKRRRLDVVSADLIDALLEAERDERDREPA